MIPRGCSRAGRRVTTATTKATETTGITGNQTIEITKTIEITGITEAQKITESIKTAEAQKNSESIKIAEWRRRNWQFCCTPDAGDGETQEAAGETQITPDTRGTQKASGPRSGPLAGPHDPGRRWSRL